MAVAETARLIASIELQDKNFTRGLRQVEQGVNRVDKKLGAFSGFVNRNVGRALDSMAVRFISGIQTGLAELAELEDATTSVTGAINQMGLKGQVTADQIATWANEIESSVEAAFDDKAIVGATTTLIRYGRITQENIRPAMEVITDLAAKTGDVDSAASLLAKALADPTKAAGKLSRQGIILTKTQQDTIKAMVEQGDVAGAQSFLLDQVSKATEGAAKASAGPYRDALNQLADAGEDTRRALAIGFLPVIKEVAGVLTTELSKPGTINALKDIGTSLAGTLRTLIGSLRQLPWGAIGDSLRIAGTGAKAVLDAFLGLPPWIQTAVLTGWGFNKISGGVLGKALGAGLGGIVDIFKNKVLGINAGVVNINAATVNGAGGIPGAAGKVGGIGVGGALALGSLAVVAAAAVAAVAQETGKRSGAQAAGVADTQRVYLTQSPSLAELQNSLAAVDAGIDQLPKDPIGGFIHQDALNTLRGMRSDLVSAIDAQTALIAQRRGEQQVEQAVNNAALTDQRKQEQTLGGLAAVETTVASGLAAHRAGERGDLRAIQTTTSTSSRQAAALVSGTVNVATGAVRSGTSIVSGAIHSLGASIRSLPPPIVNVNITATAVQKTETTQNRSGPGSGSRNHGHPGAQPV